MKTPLDFTLSQWQAYKPCCSFLLLLLTESQALAALMGQHTFNFNIILVRSSSLGSCVLASWIVHKKGQGVVFASAPTALMFERIVVSGLEMVCTLSSELLFKKMLFPPSCEIKSADSCTSSQVKSTFNDCFFHLPIVERTKHLMQCHNG